MTGSATTLVMLTDAELLVLDGACTPDTQAKVDAAKDRATAATLPWAEGLSPEAVRFVTDVVTEATTKRYIRIGGTRLRHCVVCSTRPGFAKYKSGRNAGLDNWNKPITVQGIELSTTIVSVSCCNNCFAAIQPRLTEALADVVAALPQQLVPEGATRLVKLRHVDCTNCGWRGSPADLTAHEVPFLTRCPSCGIPTGARPTPADPFPRGRHLGLAPGVYFDLVPPDSSE